MVVFVTNAQDKIITIENDTIQCKITRVTDSFIHYETDTQRSRIPMSEVSTYEKVEIQEEEKQETPVELEERFPQEDVIAYKLADSKKFRAGVSGGYTYQYAGYEGYPNSYAKQLRNMWNIGGEAHFFPSDEFGIGIKFNRAATETNQPTFGQLFDIREEISYTYIALSLLVQFNTSSSDKIYLGIAGGQLSYRDEGFISGLPYRESSDTFGLAFDLNYDISLTDQFAIGLSGGVNIATLNELRVNGALIPNTSLGVSRVDLTVGIRYYK